MIKLLFVVFSFSALAQLDHGAVTPGDLQFANCYSPFSENLSKTEIYHKLSVRGHNLKGILNDSRVGIEELKDIYQAVLLMPRWLNSSRISNESSINYKIDSTLDGVAAFDKNTLMINPKQWNNYYSDMRIAIVFHELSHGLGYNQYKIDDSTIWQDIEGGWRAKSYRRDKTIYTGSPLSSSGYVSKYSKTNPSEDFAESISSYRIKPKSLMELSLKKYNFIKDTIFLGQEFLDNSACDIEVEDVINLDEIKLFLTSKLQAGDHYFRMSYESISRSRGVKRHPLALKRLFLNRAVSILASRLGNFKNTNKEDYILKNKVRVFLTNSDDLEFLINPVAANYIAKLQSNRNLIQ